VLLLAGGVRMQVIGEGGREAVLYRVLRGQSCILAGGAYSAERGIRGQAQMVYPAAELSSPAAPLSPSP
jgi:CRP/FNR family transcriptional regulator